VLVGYNRDKTLLRLDLHAEDERIQALDLVADADVLIEPGCTNEVGARRLS